MRLENKVALITGAASGMGASMARIFAREGAKVVVADMLDAEGKKIAAEITQANGGSIVNISSISGVTGQRGIHVAYNASKGAVRTLTKAGAVQHGRHNIRINSVHPGLMPPMRTSGRTADPETRAKTLKGVPLGRAGEIDEVAYAILFLASDESSYVTGAEIVVDGGFLAV